MSADFPVEVSHAALQRLARLVSKDGRPTAFLRVGVKGGGCSGLEYVLRIDTRPLPGDHVAEIKGVPFRCDPKSARFLQGTTIDVTANLIGGGFKFSNPNADRQCGCGTSFTPRSRPS